YYLPVDGHPWGVVIRLPYDVVLEEAKQIATPLLGLQILLGGGLVAIVSLATNWVTHPLRQLASAADRIAEGDLSHPVEVRGTAGREGQDEIARVGIAFEDMRKRLKGRLEDLSLLLEVSRAVSATLELPEGVPFILEGALEAAEAQVARVVLLSGEGKPQRVMSRGEPWDGLENLDKVLAEAVRNLDRPLVIGNLVRARTVLEPGTRIGPVKALLAVPIHAKEHVSGVMWIGYSNVRQFRDSDVDLMSTLAGQMSVLIENARLFQTAEGERRRLAAILASTTDAVIVTEGDNRVLLMNPAAERAFDIGSESVLGQAIDQTPLPEALVDVFREPLDRGEAPTRELALADGRTLYANVSAILSAEGEQLGRVSLMRDITQLKQLDELKSDFIATVTHDLRAPITFMRGYTTMLWTEGELSQKQQDYIEKILEGVNRMGDLVDDLLDLRRIEADAGLARQPCHLGLIVTEAVDSRRTRADAKGITLRVEPIAHAGSAPDGENEKVRSPLVAGDAALLRQAVTNLVDNAIKYTPRGGEVVVALSVARERDSRSEDGERRALIRVKDTGIGISPEDQVRLFEKFYRVRRRDVEDVTGTGLGLAIVKSIVERHDGSVWVDSEMNQGSTFTISLPLLERGRRPDGGTSD
ncbi:MAG: ATP-binding protein, partial [Anaerolineae bacterium]